MRAVNRASNKKKAMEICNFPFPLFLSIGKKIGRRLKLKSYLFFTCYNADFLETCVHLKGSKLLWKYPQENTKRLKSMCVPMTQSILLPTEQWKCFFVCLFAAYIRVYLKNIVTFDSERNQQNTRNQQTKQKNTQKMFPAPTGWKLILAGSSVPPPVRALPWRLSL